MLANPPGNDHISPSQFGTFESMFFLFPFGGICFLVRGYKPRWVYFHFHPGWYPHQFASPKGAVRFRRASARPPAPRHWAGSWRRSRWRRRWRGWQTWFQTALEAENWGNNLRSPCYFGDKLLGTRDYPLNWLRVQGTTKDLPRQINEKQCTIIFVLGGRKFQIHWKKKRRKFIIYSCSHDHGSVENSYIWKGIEDIYIHFSLKNDYGRNGTFDRSWENMVYFTLRNWALNLLFFRFSSVPKVWFWWLLGEKNVRS